MLYAIMANDAPESSVKRSEIRPRHLQYIQPLLDEGRLLIAGPHPAIDNPEPGAAGMSGSLIIAEFESLDAARAWTERDPYTQEGVFESVTIKPFLQVLP